MTVPRDPLHGVDLPAPEAGLGTPSATMLERVIQHGIQRGIDYLRAHPQLLDAVFGNLEAAEIAKVKTYLADHPPPVLQGYARAGAKLPMLAVVLGSESTEQLYLDDFLALEEGNVEQLGAVWQMRFDVLVYAEHPDVTLWYYTILKYVVMAALRFFQASGMMNPRLQGGDMEPQPEYLPDVVYVRTLSITCQGQFPYVEAGGLGRAVAGIHRSDVEGVNARVTVSDEIAEEETE